MMSYPDRLFYPLEEERKRPHASEENRERNAENANKCRVPRGTISIIRLLALRATSAY